MTLRRTLLALSLVVPLALSACWNSAAPSAPEKTPVSDERATVSGARNAIAYSLSVLQTVQPTLRAAPLLGVYVNMFLADGLAVPVSAARAGIEAQLALHSLPTEEHVEDLYALLEEFGAVLHVDIDDLLNRSDSRAKTLDAYAVGLGNITERSTRRFEDVKEQITQLKAAEREKKATVSGLDKEVKKAVKAKDFSTAQETQKNLAIAQGELTETQSQLKEMTNIQSTLKELLEIAQDRISALQQNREVLIAGLKVVDVPGVEDLGVLQGRTKKGSTRGGFSPFGN